MKLGNREAEVDALSRADVDTADPAIGDVAQERLFRDRKARCYLGSGQQALFIKKDQHRRHSVSAERRPTTTQSPFRRELRRDDLVASSTYCRHKLIK
ncbi:hypothetical protein ACDY97_26800 [Rhizobium mongolense]|uniref:hypothetical protein n=1 Tax=Rhizobium mongolense TaxID=57676 RepID=UPI003555FA38